AFLDILRGKQSLSSNTGGANTYPNLHDILTFCYRSVRRAGKSRLGFLFIDHIPQGTCQERTVTRMMSRGRILDDVSRCHEGMDQRFSSVDGGIVKDVVPFFRSS